MEFKKQVEKYNGKDGAFVFLITIGAFMAIQIPLVAVVTAGLLVSKDETAVFVLNMIITAISQLGFLGAAYVYSRVKNINYIKAQKLNKKITIKQILLLTGIGFTLLFTFSPVLTLLDRMFKYIGYSSPSDSQMLIDTTLKFVLAAVAIGIFPAVCEEAVFRGALANGLRQYGKKYMILVSGICFSLMHQNPEQTVYQFVLGMFYAYVLLESRSLYATMLLHFLNNFIAIGMQFLYYSLPENKRGFLDYGFNTELIIAAVALVLLAAFAYLYFSDVAKKKTDEEREEDLYYEQERKAKTYLTVPEGFSAKKRISFAPNNNIVTDDSQNSDELEYQQSIIGTVENQELGVRQNEYANRPIFGTAMYDEYAASNATATLQSTAQNEYANRPVFGTAMYDEYVASNATVEQTNTEFFGFDSQEELDKELRILYKKDKKTTNTVILIGLAFCMGNWLVRLFSGLFF